jgi:DNA-binding MurR/RpiR family transcriptional regulator
MKNTKTTNNPSGTGRPIGSTIYEKDEFIKKAKAAYKGFLKRSKHPSQKDIAGKLGISRATFCRYLVKYTSWSEIRNRAQSTAEMSGAETANTQADRSHALILRK